jgi:hypothetical protein
MPNYDVIKGKKAQKQVRFWAHPKVSPINLRDLKQTIETEFPGIDERELWIVPGFMNFWIEQKIDGTLDTES